MTTAETYHVPVLLNESIDGLDIQPGGTYVDVTFGGGGHSREILRRLGDGGRLFAFDQDADAERNIEGDRRLTFVRSNFRYLSQWMRYYGVEHIDGLLADLGVSSHHLDDAARGFSFRYADAPLDMRMNARSGMTAADVLNGYSEERLADVFYLYGELKSARRMARAVVAARSRKPLATSGDLLSALGITPDDSRQQGMLWKKDMARLYQSLRIEVNREMEALRDLLTATTALLVPGGRLSVITYHSLEDRIVKNVMKTGNAEGRSEQDFYGRVTAPFRQIGKPLTASDAEQAANPRSRSAKLRIAEKVM